MLTASYYDNNSNRRGGGAQENGMVFCGGQQLKRSEMTLLLKVIFVRRLLCHSELMCVCPLIFVHKHKSASIHHANVCRAAAAKHALYVGGIMQQVPLRGIRSKAPQAIFANEDKHSVQELVDLLTCCNIMTKTASYKGPPPPGKNTIYHNAEL